MDDIISVPPNSSQSSDSPPVVIISQQESGTHDDDDSEGAVKKRQEKYKELLLEQLKKLPIVQMACEKVGVGRSTYYRFLQEDEEFRKLAEEAILEGKKLMNDFAESQLLALIRDQSFAAIQLWLKTHHNDYRTRIEVSGKIDTAEPILTPEQEDLIRQALQHVGVDEDGSPITSTTLPPTTNG